MPPTRVLILGGAGMLGHALRQVFAPHFDTWVTLHSRLAARHGAAGLDAARTLEQVDALDDRAVEAALLAARPEVVVNCIGIVKQRSSPADRARSIEINALFPHRLARLCRAGGCRLLHLSTDCVFSGNRGFYSERDAADAQDWYGRTKLLGEVQAPGVLTLRTSMIGLELGSSLGLLEWFLAQPGGSVRGWTRARFNGLSTLTLGRLLATLVERHEDLEGLWHVGADPISKFELLTHFRDAFKLNVRIEPDESVQCDRTLDDRRFRLATGFAAPPWEAMIDELHRAWLDRQKILGR